MYLCSQSLRSAYNVLLLPVCRRWSPQASPARHQRTLRDHGYGLVYHAICLFTPPAFVGYSFQFQPATEGELRLSNPRSLKQWNINRDSHIHALLIGVISNDLEWLVEILMTRSIARSHCDSWVSCYQWTGIIGRSELIVRSGESEAEVTL